MWGGAKHIFLNFARFLSGEIPSEIWEMTNLTELRLNNNQLTGEIPPEIGNLTNLIYLNLKWNQLSGQIPYTICNLNTNSNFCGLFNIL